eukprot:TRINITY_DN56583_c0_g1_i1.p1 TRINITY_DN56583_c0_g1~~TRINITY_DN56583_c0_g1_i1.p1  ORF type:complete len:502 (+),score=225.64 TRINITY_DN56583_c0_g1_i1:102-1508(+)
MVLMPEEEGEKDATFASLGVCKELCAACDALGWKTPTRIQREAIPLALRGRDVIGIAQTGSGKTGAFSLPVIQSLLTKKQKAFNACLVLCPTRELAIQVRDDFERLGRSVGLRLAVLIGGVSMVEQAIQLSKRPHVIVGTPGRVKDHLESTKGFNLHKLQFLVMDEADRMLAMDYEKELTLILDSVPQERTTALFSATMTSKVEKLQKASLRDPVKVECAAKYSTVDTLLQQYIFVPYTERTVYLHHFLSREAGRSVLVFCDASHLVQKLALTLRLLGHRTLPLYGKLDQGLRLAALGKFKEGKARVLVCTDVASRGLDIPSVDVVVNYSLPLSVKDYIHRVGRTARAGAGGRALNIVTQYDVLQIQKIEKHIGLQMQKYPADEAEAQLGAERVEAAEREASSQLKAKEKEQKEMGFGKRRREDDGDAQHQSATYALQKRRRGNEQKFGTNVREAKRAVRRKGPKGRR